MSFGWSSFLTLLTSLATVGFLVVATLWMRRFKSSMTRGIAEAIKQNLLTTQRIVETIEDLEKSQTAHDQQIRALALANRQLQGALQRLAAQSDAVDAPGEMDAAPKGHTLH